MRYTLRGGCVQGPNSRNRPRLAQSGAEEQGVAASPFAERKLQARLDPAQVTGRGMGGGIPVRGGPQQTVEQSENAPFARFAPDSERMRADAEGGREEGRRVFAIVVGLMVAASSVFSVLVAFGVLMWLVTSGNMPGIAATETAQHIGDEQIADVVQKKAPTGGGKKSGTGASTKGDKEEAVQTVDPLTLPGPIDVRLPDTADSFQSVEVICPSGSRARGRIRKLKAHVDNVPVEKGCELRLQGTRAVSIFVEAHTSYRCSSLDPVTCRQR